MAKHVDPPEKQFEKTLDQLILLVLFGKAHLKVGRGISEILASDPAVAHVAQTFWGLTTTAHFDSAQLIAFKLFDSQRGTMTIEHLLSQAEAHSDKFQNANNEQVREVIRIARIQIADLEEPLKPIRQKRNRIIAHLDSTVVRDPEKLAKLTQVTFSDLNLVFGTAGNILNEIAVKFRGTMAVFEFVDETDYESVTRLISEAKCAQIAQYEKEFGTWPGLRPKGCSSK